MAIFVLTTQPGQSKFTEDETVAINFAKKFKANIQEFSGLRAALAAFPEGIAPIDEQVIQLFTLDKAGAK